MVNRLLRDEAEPVHVCLVTVRLLTEGPELIGGETLCRGEQGRTTLELARLFEAEGKVAITAYDRALMDDPTCGFSCEVCGMRWPNVYSLASHMRKHRPKDEFSHVTDRAERTRLRYNARRNRCNRKRAKEREGKL